MGKYSLDNYEYDSHLAKNKNESELRLRIAKRRDANKGVVGWHFGCGEKPFRARSKDEFKHELSKRGLMLKDDVKRNLR